MPNDQQSSVLRRDFLRVSAGLIGTSVVSLSPVAALAQGKGNGTGATISVGYAVSSLVQAADKLPIGDDSLTSVRLTIRSQGGPTKISGLDSVIAQHTKSGSSSLSFRAWSAQPAGCAQTQCVAAVVGGTIKLAASIGKGPSAASVPILLQAGKQTGAKLREGFYFLACEKVDWSLYEFHGADASQPLMTRSDGVPSPPTFAYLIIAVTRG